MVFGRKLFPNKIGLEILFVVDNPMVVVKYAFCVSKIPVLF